MAYPQTFIDEVCSRIDLVDLIGRRVSLTDKGSRQYAGRCPFHADKAESFYVVQDRGFFHCFGCGTHGMAIDYVMRIERIEFIEALEWLTHEAGIVFEARGFS